MSQSLANILIHKSDESPTIIGFCLIENINKFTPEGLNISAQAKTRAVCESQVWGHGRR